METQRHEIEAFLGNGEHYTPEQTDQIVEEFLAWERQLGADVEEDSGEGIAVLTAIAQRVAGDLDIDAVALTDRAAQTAAANARRDLKAAVITLVRGGGMSESEAERRAGVTRMTIRSWVGK